MCASLALVGLIGGDQAQAQTPAQARVQQNVASVPAMAPADGEIWKGTGYDECDHLQGQNLGNWNPFADHNYTSADDYCVQWYDEDGDGPPSLLTKPDKWVLWYLNQAAQDTFGWWITAPDPIIGDDDLPADETPEAQRENAQANERPFTFGRDRFMILVVAFSAAGVVFSLILVAKSGDPTAAKRSARGPAYAVLALALTVPLINANVRASDAFSKWIITTGLTDGDNENDAPLNPAVTLERSIRTFLSTFDDENFVLKVLFLSVLIIATLILYLESIFRLFIVVAAAATLPVMASLSGTNYGKEFFRRTVAVVVPLCWLDTVQAIGMVFPLQILDAHRDNGTSSTQTAFICLFGIIMVCFMPGALIRITMPIASEVANSGAMNRRLADAVPATGARVVTGSMAVMGARRR
ncbi:hypothetical protein LO772_22500 [Yinghuangia sp. ASG 101]|uniref:hypothetical protein n=1 Tax=Yinghuangia sp. ASG 101 TaxID=2896848 RepID=UPI001E566783|nr:hypothetical protein [Yinghuangia sp. ASG 101]UGQ09676.1 hypothetical protein LO772_22500 [Yinghuangia sp. ASG 101]